MTMHPYKNILSFAYPIQGYCPYSDCKAMFELDEVELEQQRLNRAAAQQTRDTTRTGFAKTLFRRRLRRQSQPPPQPQRTMVECPKCHRGICLWCEHPWHDGKYDLILTTFKSVILITWITRCRYLQRKTHRSLATKT